MKVDGFSNDASLHPGLDLSDSPRESGWGRGMALKNMSDVPTHLHMCRTILRILECDRTNLVGSGRIVWGTAGPRDMAKFSVSYRGGSNSFPSGSRLYRCCFVARTGR